MPGGSCDFREDLEAEQRRGLLSPPWVKAGESALIHSNQFAVGLLGWNVAVEVRACFV